jgi:glucose-6-phosphate dehydrogenase assembly protein OpcA
VTSTDTGVLEWSAQDVDLATVERGMASLWKQLAETQQRACPVRTHIFNLVVYAGRHEEARRIEQALVQLEDRQPSRTIILYGDRTPDRMAIDVAARVLCPPAKAEKPPRACERLSICAWGRAADHLDSVVIPLLIPEIRTYLWWPGQPPFGYRSFHRLLAFADQLVIDSSQFDAPGDGLTDVARLSSGKQGVNDFHWARLVSWREIISQFFDGPQNLPYAHNVRSLTLRFGAGGGAIHQRSATAGLLLLLGWAGQAFGWEPETTLEGLLERNLDLTVIQENRLIPIHIRFDDHGEQAAGRLMLAEIESSAPGLGTARFTVERTEDMQNARVIESVGDQTAHDRVVPLSLRADAELLVDELELTGHDDAYESAVACASRFAGRVIWTPA